MMWPEPELRAIIRPEPEPEMKNRSLHSTTAVLLALPDVFQHCPSQTRMRVDESSIKLSFAFYLASTLIDSLARMASFSYSGYFLMSYVLCTIGLKRIAW